jgi:CPA1 family monovalent cation:H+ antiporter
MGLLAAVAALALLARRLPLVPYPIILVLGGLAFGLIPGLPSVRLDPELVFVFFLPPLLYPAALFTPWRDFRANLRPILLLAVGLVLFTTVAVGFLVHAFIPELPLAAGFVLGAIVSPPDAIAAIAIAEHLRLPRRIVTILEGESLVNDATALVALRFAVAAVGIGSFSITEACLRFVMVAVGGIGLGLVAGYVTAEIEKRIDDVPIEITISLLTPFLVYLASERLGVSGVLAVVATGLYHGWHIPEMTSSRTRLQAGPIWEMIEFLLNGFIFLLIGLQLPAVVQDLGGHSPSRLAWLAALISIAVILIRIIWVFPASYLPRFFSRKLRARDPYPAWQHVTIVAWTGMRGVISLAAAMALGLRFPGRELILFLTFVVILVTLIVQGLSLPGIIRWLHVKDDRVTEKEEVEARLKANQAALDRIIELTNQQATTPEIAQRVRVEYEDRIQQLEASEAEESGRTPGLFSSDYEKLSREALQVERRTIITLRDELVINDEVMRRIQRDIDLAEVRLGQG